MPGDGRLTRRSLLQLSLVSGMAGLSGCGSIVQTDRTASPTAASTSDGDSNNRSQKTTSRVLTPPAEIEVLSLTIDQQQVNQTDEVSINAIIENIGEGKTTAELPLKIDGTPLTERSVSLEAGQQARISFSIRAARPGSHTISLGSKTVTLDVKPYPAGFITQDGAQLYRDSEKFYFHGTNNDQLFRAPKWFIDRFMKEANRAGFTVVRIPTIGVGPEGNGCDFETCYPPHYDGTSYSFMPQPGEFNEAAFEAMDYVIYKAKQNGVRLVIPLVNNWESYGMAQYVKWADGAEFHDDFYTNEECKRLYKEFVNRFLTRTNSITGVDYRNDPTIFVWELANEPQAKGREDQAGASGDAAPRKLQNWIEEMAAYYKSVDSNHLLSTGGQGFYPNKGYPDRTGEDFIDNNQVDEIDICSMHLYPGYWRDTGAGFDGVDSIERHTEDAHRKLNKPIYIGEFRPSIKVNRESEDWQEQDQRRSEVYERWYDKAAEVNVDGMLQWIFFMPFIKGHGPVNEENLQEANIPYSVYPWDDATYEVMREYSERVKTKSN